MATKDSDLPSSAPNGVPVKPGTENTYARLYAVGRIVLRADGPPEYASAIKEALQFAAAVQVSMTRERFLQVLVAKKVPPDIARTIAESSLLIEDEAFISTRSNW